jgi:23S rRNA (guanosine2251-2'-O)-methyltransferase
MRNGGFGQPGKKGHLHAEPAEAMPDGIVEGRNPVLEAIKAGNKIDRLYVLAKSQDPSLRFIISKARENGAAIIETDRKKLDQMSITRAHQGVIATIPVREYATYGDVLGKIREAGKVPLFVICDHISDPNNLGAIIRTAEAAGADAVVIPKRRSSGLTAAVAKASSGALEHMDVIRVANIPSFLRSLKEDGIWIFGMSADGEKPVYEADLTLPTAIVVGSEGEGISRIVLSECDFVISIPMMGSVTSLNASAAAAVVLYEAVRQRYKARS